MEQTDTPLAGPDLRAGVPAGAVADGEMLQGHVDGEAALLGRVEGRWFAVGASCAHYGVSLAGGLLVDGTVRCPAHHAAFDLHTGEVVRGPALRAIPCWEVEERDGRVRVLRARAAPAEARRQSRNGDPESIVVVGAGAAGTAAVTELRRLGFQGRLTLIGAEKEAPYDRPNVSKDYLAGTAPEAWMPLHDEEFYRDHGIDLVTGTRVARLQLESREVAALSGQSFRYDRLLLATGAEPIRLGIPTHALPHVHYLRSIADARALIRDAQPGRTAVVVGASFIGLEAAAALRSHGLEVHLVAPHTPLRHALGAEVGDFVRGLHERNGVVFHLGEQVQSIAADHVELGSGRHLPADLVVVGIGVRPGVGLASWAGLRLHQGAVAVSSQLETSAPGVYGAGDLVAWPDPRSGALIRSEHWVVAMRQGQTAARNMLGMGEEFTAVPFFWSAHYDLTIRYVGHAERWDRVDRVGELEDGDCTLAYRAADGRTLAVATLGRDHDALRAEIMLERGDWASLDALVPAGVAHV